MSISPIPGRTTAPIPAATMLGYQAEGARTNLCLQSQTFDNASWLLGAAGTTNPVVTANQIAAPDGTLTADKIEFPAVPSGVGNRSVVYQGIVQTAAAYCDSVWLKGAVGGEVVRIASSADGITWRTSSTLALTTSWVRYEITGTSTAATWYFHIGVDQRAGQALPTSAQTIYAWGAQVELGSFATSYIPTTTVAVARNADVESVSTNGNIAAAAGSIYLEYTPTHTPSGTIALWGTYVDASNYTAILHDATNMIMRKRIAGVNYDATIANAFSANTTYKVCGSWGAAGTAIYLDGVAGTPHANTTAAQIAATMQVGADGNSLQQPGAGTTNLRIWQRQLSISEGVAVTA